MQDNKMNNENVMSTNQVNDNVILKYCNVRQYFSKKGEPIKAVHNVSFAISSGEVFGLVGEQECGKSTIGKSIVKKYKILDGDIIIGNERICAGLRSKKRAIQQLKQDIKKQKAEMKKQLKICKGEKPNDDVKNISFLENQTEILQIKGKYNEFYDKATRTIQNISLEIAKASEDNKRYASVLERVMRLPLDKLVSFKENATVSEIICQGLKTVGVKNQEIINKRLQDVLKIVGLLPEQAFRNYHDFNETQQQKVCLAQILIAKPLLLIIDEPEKALNNELKSKAFNLIKTIKEKYQISILFITKKLMEAKELCDRIGVMYFGRLIEIAEAADLVANPLHPYTKSIVSKNKAERLYYNPTLRVYSVDKPVMTEVSKNHFVYASKNEIEECLKELRGEEIPLDSTLTTTVISMEELRLIQKEAASKTKKRNVQITLKRSKH